MMIQFQENIRTGGWKAAQNLSCRATSGYSQGSQKRVMVKKNFVIGSRCFLLEREFSTYSIKTSTPEEDGKAYKIGLRGTLIQI